MPYLREKSSTTLYSRPSTYHWSYKTHSPGHYSIQEIQTSCFPSHWWKQARGGDLTLMRQRTVKTDCLQYQGIQVHHVLTQSALQRACHHHPSWLRTPWPWNTITESYWDRPWQSETSRSKTQSHSRGQMYWRLQAKLECNQLPKESNDPQPGPSRVSNNASQCIIRKQQDRLKSSSDEEGKSVRKKTKHTIHDRWSLEKEKRGRREWIHTNWNWTQLDIANLGPVNAHSIALFINSLFKCD